MIHCASLKPFRQKNFRFSSLKRISLVELSRCYLQIVFSWCSNLESFFSYPKFIPGWLNLSWSWDSHYWCSCQTIVFLVKVLLHPLISLHLFHTLRCMKSLALSIGLCTGILIGPRVALLSNYPLATPSRFFNSFKMTLLAVSACPFVWLCSIEIVIWRIPRSSQKLIIPWLINYQSLFKMMVCGMSYRHKMLCHTKCWTFLIEIVASDLTSIYFMK